MPTAVRQWAVDDGEWTPVRGDLADRITPGTYELHVRKGLFGPPTVCLRELKSIETDKILPLQGSLAEYIVNSIEMFWKSRDAYKEMGLLHKRGILMEGAPGTGKTAICLIVGHEIANRGGIAILTPPKTPIDMLPMVLKDVREMHSDLPVVNIMEDIDKHRHYIDILLPMLDGESQISNVVHLATTNYVSELDDRLTNRPSRFDEVICARPPRKQTRHAYLRAILPKAVPDKTLNDMVTSSQYLTFAHLKELAICTYVYKRPITETVARLRRLADRPKSGFRDQVEDEDEN